MISIDLETTLISEDEPIPKMVCFGTYDEVEGYRAFNDMINLIDILHFALETRTKIIFHNSAFDLLVIYNEVSEERKEVILKLVEEGLITDTYFREALYDLSTVGHKTGSYSLATLTQKYLGRTRTDKEDGWRLRYGELIGVDIEDYPQEALDYLKNDVLDTYEVWHKQEEIRKESGEGSMNSESLQIAAALALGHCTATGLMVDNQRLNVMHMDIMQGLGQLEEVLEENGFGERNKKGVFKRNTKIFKEYVEQIADVKYTAKGNVKIDKEQLSKIDDPIVRIWEEYSTLQKIGTTYLPKLMGSKGVIRPAYEVLMKTGRTSSRESRNYPGLNIQNLPRVEGLRECIIPRPGKVFASVDYASLEVCAAAQSNLDLFGASALADMLNAGDGPQDPYTPFAKRLAELAGEEYDIKYHRPISKRVNLSFPGGVGPTQIAAMIKKDSGIDLSKEEASRIKKLYLEEYPEMKRYLNKYAYSQVNGKYGPIKFGRPQPFFSYTVNGRHRNFCTYSEFCNGRAMQSLAADGAKLAAWNLFKNRISFVAFIHDEFIFEVDEGDTETLDRALEIMVDSMQEIIPDVRIAVEANVMEKCWTKNGPFSLTKEFWKDGKTRRN